MLSVRAPSTQRDDLRRRRRDTHLYDESNATRLTVLKDASRIRFVREISGTGGARFSMHRSDPEGAGLRVGRWVRVVDREDGTDLAAGVILCDLDFGDDAEQDWVNVEAVGGMGLLGRLRFPPGYKISGTLSANKSRFAQAYDWRALTVQNTGASGDLGDEVLSFDGGGSGNQLGSFTDTESVQLSGSLERSGGVWLTRTGNTHEISGTYVTPFFDFGSAPSSWDRLKYDYRYELDGVKYRADSFSEIGGRESSRGSRRRTRVTDCTVEGNALTFSVVRTSGSADVSVLVGWEADGVERPV